ncbi:hypothetical protein [Nioella ostreopsis]|uniref:hypothetical protein n=1 Tax=Nioella ostreopsis TaxID=2448479 RepID=UPI0013E05658|nr:hypothetical protein [Nioella ostreopsis]
MAFRFHQTTAITTTVSNGYASGSIGVISCLWNSIGQTRLARDELKIGVTTTASVMLPRKKGKRFQAARTVDSQI